MFSAYIDRSDLGSEIAQVMVSVIKMERTKQLNLTIDAQRESKQMK